MLLMTRPTMLSSSDMSLLLKISINSIIAAVWALPPPTLAYKTTPRILDHFVCSQGCGYRGVEAFNARAERYRSDQLAALQHQPG